MQPRVSTRSRLAHVRLERVLDSGQWYMPPAVHLGVPLKDRGLIAVAKLGYDYYENFVNSRSPPPC